MERNRPRRATACPRRPAVHLLDSQGQTCAMSGWTQRALDVNKALAELPAGGEDDAHSSDLRLHLALLRADAAPRSHTGASSC